MVCSVAEELKDKSRDRKMERKADKLLEDVDRIAQRRKEENYRSDFMRVAAVELARLGAPALITWQKLVFDKECCAQAFRLLLTRIKSSRRSAASGVSTNSSSLLAKRYATGRYRQGRGIRRGSEKYELDEEQQEYQDGASEKDETEDQIRFPPLKPTYAVVRRSAPGRKKEDSLASVSTRDVKSSGQDWNFDTTIETPPEEDEPDGFSTRWSSEKAGVSHQTGAGISIERRLPSKQHSYFSTKFKKNQLQALQEENAGLVAENSALRAEVEQLEALNAVLQNDNSNSSLDDYPKAAEFAQRRLRLVQAQNLQLQRQVSLLQDAIKARENAEVNLMSALNHWRNVIESGCGEAKAAGADQNAADTPTEPEDNGTCQPIKWMLAVPDKLMNELVRVEDQIRSAGAAMNTCFETKLRVSKLSSSFLRSSDTSLRMSEIYGREPSSMAHLQVQRIKQLENALGSISAELDQLSAEVMQNFPPAVLTTDPMRSTAYDLASRVRQLLLEVGAFGVVVPTLSASAVKPTGARTDGGDITPVDVIKVLSPSVRGPGDAKERERQAKRMLKQLHAKCTARENDLAVCRREADYWRTAWHNQDEILRRLAKHVRHLGQKKVEWCRHYLQAPMTNLAEVFASFRQAYDENTTRQNPYLPLLVETLNMEHPMLEDALQQWQEYTKRIELKMDELVADYEANRLVLASVPTALVPGIDDNALPSASQQIPVH
ncbi:hypothetical protein P3T76_002328 [Phytophthora citrophthora]|uniref:Uncharacterized protein n=1 Tax=Phytophthora citrophthora TaxID=4793 RepID=A0AAD9LSB2_9STRA|nr:hypothetical protein P3T76_002328 [Phytophthora citrophthora]